MKIRNQKIASLVKRLKRSQSGLNNPQIMHPMREWVTGLFVAIVIFAAAAIWSSFTYMEYKNVVAIEAEEIQVTNNVYRAQQVQGILQDLERRNTEYDQLLNEEVENLPQLDVIAERAEIPLEIPSATSSLATSTVIEASMSTF